MDITLRTDRLLADFFTFLDTRIGLKNCTIVFTGDHGIPPIPERVKAVNPTMSAGRVDNARMLKVCEAALDRAFGPLGEGRHWIVLDESALLFFQDVLKERNVAQPAAEKVVRDALMTLEFVEQVFLRSELEVGIAPGEYGAAMLLSFNRARGGDVYYQPKPFWLDRKTGTNHGSPYNYDVHVPLLWFGAGVKPGTHHERVGVDDIAPTLSHLLGILPPPKSRGRVLF
jgi:arylsulfatase A-like enzyme